ncbi:MAG: site-2 protease family protein [Candidatus Nanoarchaeia archaeon]
MAIKNNLFRLKELRDITIIILILAFGFSFRFPGTFSFNAWLSAFFLSLILVFISIFAHEIVHKLVARKFDALASPQLWWSGIIAFFIILLLSGGLIVFAAPWAITIKPYKTYRLFRPGRVYPHLGPREKAIIGLSGPMTNLAIAVLAKILSPFLGMVANKLIIINASLAIFNLFPFFTVLPIMFFQWAKLKPIEAPYVEGEFVFFGNRPLWVFVFIFTLVTSLSLLFLSAFVSVVLALFFAVTLSIVWHWYLELQIYPK